MSKPTLFRPVQPVRAYERIVEQVEEAMARGELKSGQRLPSERELVTQFAVSRSTVREALRVLESNGVVRSRPGDPRGPEVLAFSNDGLTKQMTRLAHVDQLSLADLVAFRMILDGSANLLAAQLRSQEQLLEMESAICDMRRAIEVGYEAFIEADMAFHDSVARASGNALIQVCTEVVRGVVLSLISDKISGSRNGKALMRRSLGHHEEVLVAVRAGDGRAAAGLARRNLYDYYAGYVPKAERAPLMTLLDSPDTQEKP
ncbi:MAG: FadR family transcriptional regulator [Actinobacteria bacterium]|nr:FadR family transcriptional regulator [Actinomycetota bacterium]